MVIIVITCYQEIIKANNTESRFDSETHVNIDIVKL